MAPPSMARSAGAPRQPERRLKRLVPAAVAVFLAALMLLSTAPAPTAAAAVVARKDPNLVKIKSSGVASPTSKVIPVTGGSAAQRRIVTQYLKKWGRYTNVGSVKLTAAGCGGRSWGRSALQVRGYTRVICIKSTLGSGNRFRYTFAHELAHATQAWAYRGYSWPSTYRSFSKVFGGGTTMRSLDNAADCAAEVMVGKSVRRMAGQVPYKSGCSAKQHAAAKKVLKGKRL